MLCPRCSTSWTFVRKAWITRLESIGFELEVEPACTLAEAREQLVLEHGVDRDDREHAVGGSVSGRYGRAKGGPYRLGELANVPREAALLADDVDDADDVADRHALGQEFLQHTLQFGDRQIAA